VLFLYGFMHMLCFEWSLGGAFIFFSSNKQRMDTTLHNPYREEPDRTFFCLKDKFT